MPQAAATLGITEGAVRGRVKRGTLGSHREGGKVYVILEGVSSSPKPDETSGPQSDQSELIAVLREQLAAERQGHAEARRIIAGLVERIPQLEAPQEPPEDAETVEEATDVLGAERARQETAELIATLHEGMAEERRRREEAERERDDLRRELFGRREPTDAPEAAEEQQGRGQPPSDAGEARSEAEDTPAYWWPAEKTAEGPTPRSRAGGAQEGARRPWWRRIFRGQE